MQSNKNSSALETILETSELTANFCIENEEILSYIPCLGKAVKLAVRLRDRAFEAKLTRFVTELDKFAEKDKEKYKNKLQSNPDESIKVGETLFFILDRLTDMNKPVLLSYIFIAYIDDIVTSDELRRLAQAIDSAFYDDLEKLITDQKPPEKSMEQWMQYLSSSGLTRATASNIIEDIGKIFYEVTPLGMRLRDAYFYGHQATAF